ncbi:MAG: hypothetical protein OEM59_09900 [Rhodospirillales bacterium]|nr:hypothetical protein [Rhodospirillales bacterium]
MRSDTNIADFTAPTHSPPILAMARRLELLYQEEQGLGTFSLTDEIEALEIEISENPATTLQEAAVQVMLISAFIERVREDLAEDTDALLKRMARMARSALSAVVRETGVDLAEFGGERYTPIYTDPFRKIVRCN